MNSLQFVTWNVRGVGSIEKRQKMFNHLKNTQADIVLLQETHMSKSAVHTLHSPQFPHTYLASYNSKQRGVAILINRRVNFTLHNTITDTEGRYIIMNISVDNVHFCIANIYGPNVDDPSFFHAFFSSLSAHLDTSMISGGDLNLVFNPEVDRSSPAGRHRESQSTSILKKYMNDFGLCDAWRSYHPTHREYTYFSPVHHTYSRIDYFLTSNSVISDISNIHIHPITISDHAPVSLFLTNQTMSAPTRCWRLNTSLLKDSDFLKYFEREWTMFLDFNDQPGVSASILWEAAKAVMRGKTISYSSYKKKKERLLESELEKKIQLLETAHADSKDEHILSNLRKLKLDLKEITDKKIQFQLQRLRLEKFEHGNKHGKYLANQLKVNKEKSSISSIRNSGGHITHLPEEINSVFRSFYKNLYTPQIKPSLPDIKTFLNNIELPKLNDEQVTNLDVPISFIELHNTLHRLPNNKAPGPDGFPAEFYKTFWSLLSPIFLRMVLEIKDSSCLPPTMNSATISFLLKPDKDPTLPSSYRPISLINADLKIICKALAIRLEKVTPHIIHPDQSGFIKGRNSTSNVCRLINLIDYSIIHNLETTIVSLDAEKAFDRVNWKFLFATLQKFGFVD
ncbi:E3 ubiquitin-protein ligase znrf1 isoform X1 [Dunckerocampus dactyliophorus]|uniref:E3 ubiquitin-protein ligase znrf1 isoform X1 n=1 Tax=Dunckerocampus dactyliophorus TaxID=161453 RepID=UPI0024061E05|nr:E3 ubiquitin-protein ligase znrf1 isoform X1 [Dunckerocampus dactyliophorus]